MSKQRCRACGGDGYDTVEVQDYQQVTRDMATDAEDPSLEGEWVPWGSHQEQIPCPYCNGTGEIEE